MRKTICPSLVMSMVLMLAGHALADPAYVAIADSIVKAGRNRVAFEEKIVAFYLDEPLVSRGMLYYEPPDKLTKIVEEPEYIRQRIQGGQVTVTRNGTTQSFSLSSHLVLETMVNTLRSLLSGDLAAIENEFSITVDADNRLWKMVLLPEKDAVLEEIESVVIEGAGGVIRQYTITERNGDYTVTSLHDEDSI